MEIEEGTNLLCLTGEALTANPCVAQWEWRSSSLAVVNDRPQCGRCYMSLRQMAGPNSGDHGSSPILPDLAIPTYLVTYAGCISSRNRWRTASNKSTEISSRPTIGDLMCCWANSCQIRQMALE